MAATGLALTLYEELIETTDERTRQRLIADAIGVLEERWPAPDEIARRGDVREAEPAPRRLRWYLEREPHAVSAVLNIFLRVI